MIRGQEISLIDENLVQFPPNLPTTISYLNLHCNQITVLDRDTLIPISRSLRTLDISSNLLSTTDGVEVLVGLTSLNLACNKLNSLTPAIALLTNLQKLDLSFNALTDITPLQSFSTPNHKLKILLLHGNRLSSIAHVSHVLRLVYTLRELVLKRQEVTNPLCERELDYKEQLYACLTSVQILDGVDPHGAMLSPSASFDLLPEIEELLQLQLEAGVIHKSVATQHYYASESPSLESSISLKETPRVDRALQLFREDKLVGGDGTDNSRNSTPSSSTHADQFSNATRLEHIEELLVHMMDGNPGKRQDAEVDHAGNSLDNAPYEFDPFEKDSDSTQSVHSPPTCLQRKSESKRANFKKDKSSSNIQVEGKKCTVHKDAKSDGEEGTAVRELVSELESERERRWKAEEASRRLVAFIRELQGREGAVVKKHEIALAHGARLDTVVAEQASRLSASEARAQGLVKEMREMRESTAEWTGKEARYQDALKKIQVVYKKLLHQMESKSSEFQQEFSLHQKSLETAKQELSVANISNSRLKEQLQELQALFVNQEQHNQCIAARMIARDGPELRQMVEREGEKCKIQIQALTDKFQFKLNEAETKYKALEEEFRMALRIEADRFTELESKFCQVAEEFERSSSHYKQISARESKATQLVSELTKLAKEQKQKIHTLTDSSENMLCEFQAKICSLQEELETARLSASSYEEAVENLNKLKSELKAERSISEGLRLERELWSQELARQGASLAHDQGRLEAQVESQRSELTQLAKLLSEERDKVKIKGKIIADQNETISELKTSIKAMRDESTAVTNKVRESEKRLSNQNNEYQQLEMQYEDLSHQLLELKQCLELSNEERDSVTEKYSYLKSQWNEKLEVIGTIENEMIQAKQKFAEREKLFQQEKEHMTHILNETKTYRDKADLEKKSALSELAAQFNEKVSDIRRDADARIAKSGEKVREVEEEMRALLVEISQERQHTQKKFQKLTSTIQDIQNN